MDKKIIKSESKPKSVIKDDDEIIIVASDDEATSNNDINEPETVNTISNNNTIDSSINNKIDPKYKNLVLSGGSIKGISHIGAVKRLIEEKLIDLNKLKAVAGASAGSLFGLLIVLGFSIDEIWNFIYCLDMKNMVKPDFLAFLKKCGVETGQIIYNLLEEILTKKTGIKHINFRQLYEITKIHFIVVGSCLTTREAIYYDHLNTPNFKVSMAIRISIGIPGFFTPITIGQNKYVDGAILNNFPMNLFRDKMDETIGILICNEYNTKYQYPEEYFLAIMNLFMYNYFENTAAKYSDNTVYVNKAVSDIHIFSFDISNEAKIELYNCGIEASEEFIRRKSGCKIVEGDF
ncbi:putative patatin-like phospholipase [Tupanvirus deep ocean]|uniref:Patatin-like phospholipase n=1 Tax=Tupanvirus soda lake TaxID=2126985 RepID=A0AC59HC65_9VIRU|nr:putative patatin-like phospholipase [Tupanvirus deep ocean]AUL79492.2 putative patatin-like phospholipase [Tupanvirus deep ocean]